MMTGSKAGKRRLPKSSDSPRVGSNAIPVIYQEMLVDAVSSSPSRFNEEGNAIKRRRIGGRVVLRDDGATSGQETDHSAILGEDTDTDKPVLDRAFPKRQTAYNDSDNSQDSDMDWEEVDLVNDRVDDNAEESAGDVKSMDLVITAAGAGTAKQHKARRKGSSAVNRKMRLEIHKAHLLCLLAHVHLRNHWCEDSELQATLRGLLTKRTISYLNPNSEQSQFQRSRSFMDGLTQASEAWRARFKVTARGMRRPYWVEHVEALRDVCSGKLNRNLNNLNDHFRIPEDVDPPLAKSDFHALATKHEGSRDVGAQLFCALLRSVGVDTRLICSLQPLPFTAAVKTTTPQKLKPEQIFADLDSRPGTSDEDSGVDVQHDIDPFAPTSSSTTEGPSPLVPRRPRRLGQPTFTSDKDVHLSKVSPLKVMKRKRIKESPYPVFWVEAFNAAVQKWVPVDPLVTNAIAKPSKFEPPASDAENNMSYVVAFEEDGTARDVTRRYTKAYNAKTRKNRIESTKGGERWWRRTMRVFQRAWDLDRDQVEDAELTAKEAAEEMPRNVQDFKDHPYYALERHLKRNEVLHPKREVGKIGAGKALSGPASKALEPIYRRRDVHHVKSADGWYRLGREIKAGEQPLKRVQPRRQRLPSAHETDDEDDPTAAGTALYAAFQTTPYIPPPIVNGRVPKNAYGNLDIYVPSMIPRGGVHLPHPDAARAAKTIGVDYADAVTGFEFKGRYGTAVVKGIIAAVEYREALEEVVSCFADERVQAEEKRRSVEALRMWRRFLAGVRVMQRIEGYEFEGEGNVGYKAMVDKADKEALVDEGDGEGGGGFLPDRDREGIAEPTVGRFDYQKSLSHEGEEIAGGLMSDNVDEDDDLDAEEEFRSTQFSRQHRASEEHVLARVEDEGGGGFVLDDSSHEGGGFMAEEDEHDIEVTPRGMTVTDEPDPGHALAGFELDEAITLQRLHDEGTHVFTNEESAGGGFMADEDPITKASESFDGDVNQEEKQEAHADDRADQGRGVDEKHADDHREQGRSVNETPSVHECSEMEEGNEKSEEEDRGSLLSHDPEDEDADPEWLASD